MSASVRVNWRLRSWMPSRNEQSTAQAAPAWQPGVHGQHLFQPPFKPQEPCEIPMLSPAAGTEALLSLLLLAREHAVEPAVAACLQLLLRQVRWVERRCSRFSQHMAMAMKQCLCCSHVASVCSTICTQASQLPAIVCLTFLNAMETGCSAHDSVQVAARQLASACYYRVFTTLREPATIADKDVQAALLRYLGPLHEMLDDSQRRQLFMCLPFNTMRVSVLGG